MVSNVTITLIGGLIILASTILIPIITREADAVKVFIAIAIGFSMVIIPITIGGRWTYDI